MENNTVKYLQFLPVTREPVKILWMEENNDFQIVKEIIPHAINYFLVENKIVVLQEKVERKEISWADLLNYILPCEKNFFDYIIVGDYNEKILDLKKFYRQMAFYLKANGKILARFSNVRHWKRIKELMVGKSITMDREKTCRAALLWCEVVDLFEQTGYQEIQADPVYETGDPAFLEILLQGGFENGDLEISSWGIKACKIEEMTERLQKSFTENVRRELVFLIRRVEYDIDVDQNCARIWNLCEKEAISAQYVAALAENSLVHVEKVLLAVAASSQTKGQRWQGILLLQDLYENKQHTALVPYVLASLLYLQKEYNMAETVLSSCKKPDQDTKDLLELVRRDQNAK